MSPTAGHAPRRPSLPISVLSCLLFACAAGAATPDMGSAPAAAAARPVARLSAAEGCERLAALAAGGAKSLPAGGEALGGVIVVALAPEAAEKAGSASAGDEPWDRGAPRPEACAPLFREVEGTPLAGTYLVFLEAEDPNAAAASWSRAPGVRYAEPYFVHRTAAVPDDPYLPLQLHLEPVGAFAAWDAVRGETHPVATAVVDGGIDVEHPDLAPNVMINDADPPNGIDDDGNGYVDDTLGWNFATGTGDPAALVGVTPLSVDHGTHVAGILSAVSDNGQFVAGMTWNGPVLCVAAGHPSVDNLVLYGYQGILYAAQRGVRLINCSWGRSGRSSLLEIAVLEHVAAMGAVVVAAAGNEGVDTPFYPAAYRTPFAVTNVTAYGTRYLLSNYGTWVDLAAPGTFIYSLLAGGRGGHMSGTSMAAPVVTGAAALLWGLRPDLAPDALLETLRVTGRPLGDTLGDYADSLGGGMLQADAALAYAGPGYRFDDLGLADADGDGLVELGERVTLNPRWRNLLSAGTAPVFVSLTAPVREIEIRSGTAQLGPLGAGASGEASAPFVLQVSPFAAAGSEVELQWELFGGAGGTYHDRFTTRLSIAPLFTDLASGEVQATITANGRIGFEGVGGGNGRDGLGVRYVQAGAQDMDGPLNNLLFEGALMLGTGPDRISNGARRAATGAFDEHFVPVGSQRTPRVLPPIALADGQRLDRAGSVFRDALAPDRLGVVVAWDLLTPPAGEGPGCALLVASVRNEGNEILAGFRYGYFLDWDLNGGGYFPAYAANSTGLDPGGLFATAVRADGVGPFVTTALVADGGGGTRFRAIDNTGTGEGWGIYDGFSDAEKWEALAADDGPTTAERTDISQTWAGGPVTLAPGDSVRFVLVLAAGATPESARRNVLDGRDLAARVLAQARWAPPPLPLSVGDPYPNPWNGEVSLAVAGNPLVPWRFVVYDLRGRRVHEARRELPGSEGVLTWDGTDLRGRPVASGVYLLRVGQGAVAATRKILVTR